MKIAYLYNLKRTGPSVRGMNDDDIEYEDPIVVDTVERVLQDLGHTVLKIEADIDAFDRLKKNKRDIDIVFNMAEGTCGDARESQVPFMCEMLGIPYTHSRPTAHAVALDKQLAKRTVAGVGIRSPRATVARRREDWRSEDLILPVIVKLNNEGSSKALGDTNVVRAAGDLETIIDDVSNGYTRDVLIEEFIDGREFTAGVVGNTAPHVLPILEQKFDLVPPGRNAIASYDFKMTWSQARSFECPAHLTVPERLLIAETTKKVFRTLGCRDCARVDYRMGRDGTLYFIEVNALPGLHPAPEVLTYFPLMAYAAGMDYGQLIEYLLMTAVARYPHLQAHNMDPARA